MLASLACGQNDSRSGSSANHRQREMPSMPAVSDTSDDDTTVAGPAKSEIVVARRRRRPIKKRIPMGDYRPSVLSSSSSSVSVPRKSLLESSIFCISPNGNRLATRRRVVQTRAEEVFALHELSSSSVPPARAQGNEDDNTSMENNVNETDDDVPVLVCDDEPYKHIHSPLVLPSYLPCPASALRCVQSISLTLEER